MDQDQEKVMRQHISKALGRYFTWPNASIEDLVIEMIRLYVKITKEN